MRFLVSLLILCLVGWAAASAQEDSATSRLPRPVEALSVDNAAVGDASGSAARSSGLAGACEGRVSVQGQAEVNKATDEAHVTMTVELERKTAREARQAAARVTTNVQTAILAIDGVDSKQLTTNYINVQPKYVSVKEGRETWRQVIDGYTFQNSFTARVDGVDATDGTQVLGQVVDAAVEAGGDDLRVDNIWFSLSRSEREAAMVEVRKMAADNAVAKAEAYASQLGVTVGQPLRISEWRPSVNDASPAAAKIRTAAPMLDAELGAASFSTPIAGGGDTTVGSNVYVVFELCEEATGR